MSFLLFEGLGCICYGRDNLSHAHKPIMSSGETNTVKDFERVSPTVIRPRQSSVSSVGEPLEYYFAFRNPILGWATIATCAVPPAELAIVSTRSVRA